MRSAEWREHEAKPEALSVPYSAFHIPNSALGGTMSAPEQVVISDKYDFSFADKEDYFFKAQRGLSREVVAQISQMKDEPGWMTDFRLKSYEYFVKRPMPTWG